MAQSPEEELASFERDVLPAWEAAQILLDSHGTRAPALASERIKLAMETGNDTAKAFWYKVLEAVNSLSTAERNLPGHDS